MLRLLALCLMIAAFPTGAQQPSVDPAALALALTFEGTTDGRLPTAWRGAPTESLSLDREGARSGEASGRIDRGADSAQQSSTLTTAIPIEFSGATVELRGFLRTQDVAGSAGFWMREDGPGGALQFDNMSQRGIDGTRDWAEYRITLPLASAARQLFFGAWLMGQGTVWADDIEILVDGKPLREAARRTPTVLETDLEFTSGSGVTLTELSEQQVQNLTVLGRVWGFLKYHHPRVAKGELHWDFELFRVLPAVLAARTHRARNDAVLDWVRLLGDPEPCNPCAAARADAQLLAAVDWIHDGRLLGEDLSSYLENVYRNRWSGGAQFYVSAGPGVGNPVFDSELAYESLAMPDTGYRLAALFRYWNMIEYWFPNRDVIGEPWPGVLTEFVPVLAAAETRDTYALALTRLIARINDTHANLRGALVLPPIGTCQVPVALRPVEGMATVSGYVHPTNGPATGLLLGDVIATVDSVPVEQLFRDWTPLYSASNEPTKSFLMVRSLLRGACEPAELVVLRGAEQLTLRAERLPLAELDVRGFTSRDRPGDTFQWLDDDVAYLKLSSIKQADVKGYVEGAQRARGLIVDIRNYPSEFVVFALGGHLVQQPTEFVQFSGIDLRNPGTFAWTGRPPLQPLTPYFGGKVAVLVDETTLSQAEYTAMALRATPNAIVVGSTTAGADGNVSAQPLPGGLGSALSGIGVFYPDRSPTQRVGIVPDVVVTPTIAGIRDGRDEVLERALQEVLGAAAAPSR